MSTVRSGSSIATGRRLLVFAMVGLLAGLDLAVKAWAQRRLAGGRSMKLGVVDLQLGFNPGVAFGLGDTLPPAVVLGGTGALIAGLTVLVWRLSGTSTLGPVGRFALAGVLAGAIGNFADRAVDGVVTDYLHTGWFPTFNGADVLITTGAAALVLTSFRPGAGTDVRAEDKP